MVVMVVRGLRDLCSGVVVVMVLLSREDILDILLSFMPICLDPLPTMTTMTPSPSGMVIIINQI
jgi:hypothetical protein